jgi:hypothetical protein
MLPSYVPSDKPPIHAPGRFGCPCGFYSTRLVNDSLRCGWCGNTRDLIYVGPPEPGSRHRDFSPERQMLLPGFDETGPVADAHHTTGP